MANTYVRFVVKMESEEVEEDQDIEVKEDSKVKEECKEEFLKDSRKYATRKHRSCHKRNVPMPEKERKEENKKNSRNYTKRNRDEIVFCRAKLSSEKILIEEKCQLANMLFGTKLEREVQETLNKAEIIMKHILGEGLVNRDVVDECFEMYEQKKKEVHNMIWKKSDYSFEEEYNELKQEFEDLMKTKSKYIKEKGRTNFASAKSRLYQKVLRAELKRECYVLHCALKNVEQKIENLQACDIELKNTIWSKFLQPIDEYFETSTSCDKEGEDYTEWQKIMKFYEEQRKVETTPPPAEKREKKQAKVWKIIKVQKVTRIVKKITTEKVVKEEPEEEPLSVDSQINKAAENMDSEWTSKRLPWDELVGDHVPEADNEVTISTTPQPPASVVNVPVPIVKIEPPVIKIRATRVRITAPPAKIIKLENPIDEKPKNLLTISNQIADSSLPLITEDTPIRDILAYTRKRKTTR